jgi:hypothetical protein
MSRRVIPIIYPIFLSIVIATSFTALNAKETIAHAPMSYVVGGTPILIPPPSAEFGELGDDARGIVDLYVPTQNRLIAAFYPTDQLALLKKGKGKLYSRNGLVEVSRRGEFTNYTAESFQELTQSIDKKLSTSMGPYESDAQNQLNRRLQQLNQGEITLDQPTQLGILFSKQGAYAFASAAPAQLDGATSTRLIATILICVKSRVIFVYLSDLYKGQETVKWARALSEEWADAILLANKD